MEQYQTVVPAVASEVGVGLVGTDLMVVTEFYTGAGRRTCLGFEPPHAWHYSESLQAACIELQRIREHSSV